MSEVAQDPSARAALTPYAPSLATVPYTRIRELGELAMSMDGVLRLYFGESNLPTPGFIVDAAARALREGHTFYSENAGLPALRREIADQYMRLHDVELDPATEVVVTASGLQALHLAIRSVVDPGDEVVILSPAWPNSTSIVALSHGIPVDVPLRLEGERYRIDFAQLTAALGPRTRLVVLTSPSNPLGWVAAEEEQLRLLEMCRRARHLVAGRRSLRTHLLCRCQLRRPGPLDPAAVPTGRPRPCCAVVFEELLHDRLAGGVARDQE